MYHELPRNASFWAFLFSIDQDLAEQARQKKCPCGGCLHRANYPRKPRGGGEDLPQEYDFRLSFCCEREGCRKRVTPPSVRFLGRKVYLGAVVILVAAMRQGPSPGGSGSFPGSSAPIGRPSPDGRSSGANTSPRRRSGRSPAADWCRRSRSSPFRSRCWRHSSAPTIPAQDWRRLLRFLAPITIAGGLAIEVSR